MQRQLYAARFIWQGVKRAANPGAGSHLVVGKSFVCYCANPAGVGPQDVLVVEGEVSICGRVGSPEGTAGDLGLP
jgi:hypothetical protein